jgi:hypothetical protein
MNTVFKTCLRVLILDQCLESLFKGIYSNFSIVKMFEVGDILSIKITGLDEVLHDCVVVESEKNSMKIECHLPTGTKFYLNVKDNKVYDIGFV